jgi:hypothetical protein
MPLNSKQRQQTPESTIPYCVNCPQNMNLRKDNLVIFCFHYGCTIYQYQIDNCAHQDA